MEGWVQAAEELDKLEGNECWRRHDDPLDDGSSPYDAALISGRLKMLLDAQSTGDVEKMMYLIRTSLSRNLGGINNPELYAHGHVGTKYLIESYIETVISVIRTLVAASLQPRSLPEGLETKDLLEQVVYARQAFGRSALLLSGGATLGMYHVGALKALFTANLLPRIISGASAGSIVGSVLCTKTDAEIPEMLDMFPYGDLSVFEEQDRLEGVQEHMTRLLTRGAWIDIKHLTRVMRSMLGEMTFQEAYNRTRRILNICVSPSSVYELPTLLNYITAPNVLIWSAVAASCSIPLVFSSAELRVKNPLTGEEEPWSQAADLRWIDGSVDNDLPMTRLAEMFNVNHFIVSQVNPHVTPFLSTTSLSLATPSTASVVLPRYITSRISSLVAPVTEFAKSEALHRLQILSQLRILPNLCNKTRNMLSQKYSGDITILPKVKMTDFDKILKNPTPEFMLNACIEGERATWPLVGRVRMAVSVELALDRAVGELRGRVVFGGEGRVKVKGEKPGRDNGRGRGMSHDGTGRGAGHVRTMSGVGHVRLLDGAVEGPLTEQHAERKTRPRLKTSKSCEHRGTFLGMETPTSQGRAIDLGHRATDSLGSSWEDLREPVVVPMTKISTVPRMIQD